MRTVEEVDALFEQDGEGRFLRLILPADKWGGEKDLTGLRFADLDRADVVRVKKYAGLLYEEALRKTAQ